MVSFLNAHILPQVEGREMATNNGTGFFGRCGEVAREIGLIENRTAEVCTLLRH